MEITFTQSSCKEIMKIQVLFMDVDGTLTDGKIYMGNHGEVMKAFSIKDGQGITHLQSSYDVIPVIITGRRSEIVKIRCEELKINDYHQDVHDKIVIIKEYEKKYPSESFSYIGDDSNDVPAMEYIKSKGGITACPADAEDSVKAIADFVCERPGGGGAVRDFIDYMIQNDYV